MHIYYIQELFLETVLVNTYFASATVPILNEYLEKEFLSYNTQLTDKEPVNSITLSELKKLQILRTHFDCTTNLI